MALLILGAVYGTHYWVLFMALYIGFCFWHYIGFSLWHSILGTVYGTLGTVYGTLGTVYGTLY